MAFLRSSTGHDSAVTLRGRGVWLRAPLMGDYAPWAELRAMSRDHLTPWEPVWQRDELSRSAFRRRVRHYQRESREDLGYAFLIFSDADDQLVGGLTLSNVRRGVTQAAVLGYWLGKPFVCRGLHDGSGARRRRLRLRGAASAPAGGGDDAEQRGLDPRARAQRLPPRGLRAPPLKINGVWEDHVLHALLGDDAPRRTQRGALGMSSTRPTDDARDAQPQPPRRYLVLAPSSLLLVALPGRAFALKPIVIEPDQDRVEVTTLGEFYDARGDSLQVETAPAADGMTGRISVTAKTPGTNPNWVVFALTNPTDKPVERWLTAERYNIIGSGAVWPDLDAQRIEAVTPSIGYIPERIKSDRADIFRITIEPGQTVTYVAELASDRFARLYLWKPLEYELYSRDRLLFNGIMLGLTGLLAIFLTAIFAANHKADLPECGARRRGACWPTCASTSASSISCSSCGRRTTRSIERRANPPSPPASSSSYRCSCASRSGTASYACCSRCGSSRS